MRRRAEDPTTKTGPKWTIMVPALEEQYDLGEFYYKRYMRFDAAGFLRGNFAWDAFDKLARRETMPQTAFDVDAGAQMRNTRPMKTSALEDLPAELLSILFADASLSTRDIVSLALVSRTLWAHLLGHLARIARRPRWAGTPLVCTSTYLLGLPKGIHELHPDLKQATTEFYETTYNKPQMFLCASHGMPPIRRFNWDARRDFTDLSQSSFAQRVVKAFENVTWRRADRSVDLEAVKASLVEALYHPQSEEYNRRRLSRRTPRRSARRSKDPVTDWALRNLTTREYAILKHRKVYRTRAKYYHIKGMPSLTLDKMLIMVISWSWGCPDDQPIRALFEKGPWAGHCFDVVKAQVVEAEEGWEDVTVACVQQGKEWKASGP